MKYKSRLRNVLNGMNKTETWLAGELGVTRQQVSLWCTNINKPGQNNINKILTALDKKYEEVF